MFFNNKFLNVIPPRGSRLFEEDRLTQADVVRAVQPTWPSVCTFHLNAALALSSRRAMQQCLNRQVTKSNSCGDLFKLVVPVGWTVTAFMATLAYLLAPLRRQEPPRWGTAALVSLSAFAGVGASLASLQFSPHSELSTK